MTDPTTRPDEATDLAVRAYTSDRAFHLDRPDYCKIVRREPGLPPVQEQADALVRELAERSHRDRLGWRRFRIVPVTSTAPTGAAVRPLERPTPVPESRAASEALNGPQAGVRDARQDLIDAIDATWTLGVLGYRPEQLVAAFEEQLRAQSTDGVPRNDPENALSAREGDEQPSAGQADRWARREHLAVLLSRMERDVLVEALAAYIAAMGPGVGTALAAWLDSEAARLRAVAHPAWHDAVASPNALTIARAINRQEP